MSGNFNPDPRQSALFTGAGTNWGAMQSADPGDMPSTPIAIDPSTMKAYDQSAMVKSLISGLRSQGSQEQMAANRQAARMGAGQSDAARSQVQGIAGDVQNRAAGVKIQAAKDSWDSQMQQAQFQDQLNMQRYNAALQQWQAKKGMYDAEKAKRAGGLQAMFGTGDSSVTGQIFGKLKDISPGK